MSNTYGGKPINGKGVQRSTECTKESEESIHCVLENIEKKEVCQPYFDIYKACRAEANKNKWEERAKAAGKDSWFK